MKKGESPKKTLFRELAGLSKALGHPNRLELLEQAAQGSQSVDALAAATGLSVGNASQHLQQLRRAGLLRADRDGNRVRYGLADPSVLELVRALQRVAERSIASIRELLSGYFLERDDVEALSRQELSHRLRDGSVTLIDVRPPREFALGHIPGALNIPMRELGEQLDALPPDREVIAYCRGPYCVLSYEAVAALRERGLAARRLEDGLPEWRAAGLPIES